ncbi:SGNH/GDSL hydrolase family protein [Actinoplanes sp. TBRC 11911]|uniref:SGNH/GDSL hydrolase family protein n=1 Tax=Actinoplanes sp. TBRC 11911 TaxID=2729386 RepID=UPI00289E7637|nr:SGNH/GDSL hydrolase family protein [Actinoplanes sp. TBRC 11911]
MAVGDSFTEGMADGRPDGTLRGWADLVAAGLASSEGEAVRYANLAVRGRLLEPIVDEQLEAALSLDPPPTLISFNGGFNDMMRPRVDMAGLTVRTERAIRRSAEAGVRLVLLSAPDPSERLPFGRVMRRRGEILAAAVAGFAVTYDVPFVDVFHDAEIRRVRYWSPDRLHLNAAGHRRVASLVLNALGCPTAEHVAGPGRSERRGVMAEARFYREHVLPWVMRRAGRRSSGDNRSGKIEDWIPIEATVQ